MYYSMEYIEGETLKQSLHGSPQPPRTAALLVQVLARAVAFAHRHGIVHRDLKPANVLLETIDASESDDRAQRARLSDSSEGLTELGLMPKIVDFGLAKRLDDSLGTQTGQLMGTPSYMSPEQLAGRSGATGPGVDIYALGCILYEALTGRPPFLDASLEVLADRVRREEPVPLRRLRPGCPRNLETICLKCLEKEPARRYAGAAELADDLGRYLAGEPIKARAPSMLDRCVKFARRNRTLVGGVAGVVIALALGIVATSVMAFREAGTRQRADLNAQRADAARMDARRGAYQARLTAAMAAVGIHDIREASRQLDQAPEELRGWEWRHLQGRLDQSLAVVAGRSGKTSIAFCPPGRRVAVADGRSDYRLLDAVTGESLDVRGTDTPDSPCRQVFAFSTSAGPRFVVDQSAKGLSLYLADGSGAALSRIGLTDPSIESLPWPCVMAMSPDGRRLALQILPYSPRPLVEVFDTSTGRLTARLGADQSRLRALDFSPDGKQIAAVDEDSRVHIFDLQGKSPQMNLPGHSADLWGVAYSRDGNRLASCGADQTIRVWDTLTRKTLHTLRGHKGGVLCVAFSPDGRRLVSGGSDSTVRLWDAEGGEAVLVLHGHAAEVNRVAFSDDGRTIASTAEDGTARLWDAMAPDDASVLRGHSSYVYPVAYSPDGRWIASGSWDRTICLWDAASGYLARKLSGFGAPLGALAFTPDGSRLVSWSEDATIRFWDTTTGAEIAPSVVHRSMGAAGLGISPGSHSGWQASRCAEPGGVRFWNLETHQEMAFVRLSIEGIRVIALSPDGRRLAAGGDESKIVIAESTSGKLLTALTGFTGRIQSVAFSPDGRYVLAAGQDAILRLWDAANGQLVRTFAGHGLEVLSAIFHPDGTRIASGGHDRSIRIWDTFTGEEMVRLPGHTWYVFSLAFSPDGETLVSGSGDSTVRLWDAFPVARRLQSRRRRRARAHCLVDSLGFDRPSLDRLRASAVAAWRVTKSPSATLCRVGIGCLLLSPQ